MGWRTVVIRGHSKLSYRNNYLLYQTGMENEPIYLPDIDCLLLETTDISITTMLLKRLVDEKILVIFCDDKRLPKAMLTPFYGRHDASLQLKKQMDWSEQDKKTVWTHIIEQKINNQSLLLDKCSFVEKSLMLDHLSEELRPGDPSNCEAHAAQVYFKTLFGKDFIRQEDDPVNAGLNYGYSLLLGLFAREIVCNGCVTQLGLMHKNQFNDFNLASDLMEPFRPIVDTIIYAHREEEFPRMKKQLFSIFTNTITYGGKEMHLSNIVSDYTRRSIAFLNQEANKLPSFQI